MNFFAEKPLPFAFRIKISVFLRNRVFDFESRFIFYVQALLLKIMHLIRIKCTFVSLFPRM